MKKELLNCILKVTKDKDVDYINQLINNFIYATAIYTFDDIVTKNQNVKKIVQYAKKAANTDCSILIQGSNGTGKEVFAEAIHNYSKRADGPFIVADCAIVPRELLKRRLFGYCEETFTGEKEEYPGKFQLAHGGTLFLDNIEELPLDMQEDLLKILEDNKASLRQSDENNIDVRIIVATNKNLIEEVNNKSFRADLYYKLNVINLKLLDLEDRKEDIPLLVKHYLQRLNTNNLGKEKTIDEDAIEELKNYKWIGNIRELRNFVEKLYYLCDESNITRKFLLDYIYDKPKCNDKNNISNENSLNDKNICSLRELEKQNIEKSLVYCEGNVEQAAKILGISRATIYRKISKYNIKLH
ncbi:transcriptional regulator [Clostridium novyi A str. 4570]|uniref:Transcriptional regulator n=1 Tax=Clostridium novyi A str. 4570 TaxID=1444290 RepID=A0AA88ZQD7_CLONO|nr:sigma-54 dependent transcriptional regulator [Clostridium novyi]KGN03380.1 transcriptional regulator [Clostridium novyi A str. 4570]